MRYTTGIYEEPIKMRVQLDSASCLKCHEKTKGFNNINSYIIALDRFKSGGISVLILLGFVISRNPYLMGASVFVAISLLFSSIAFYVVRVLTELRRRKLL